MIDAEACTTLARYNAWMNERLDTLVATLQSDHAKRVFCRDDAGIEFEGFAEKGFRARKITAIEPDLPHLIADEWVFRIELQVALETSQRRIVVAHSPIRLRQI